MFLQTNCFEMNQPKVCVYISSPSQKLSNLTNQQLTQTSDEHYGCSYFRTPSVLPDTIAAVVLLRLFRCTRDTLASVDDLDRLLDLGHQDFELLGRSLNCYLMGCERRLLNDLILSDQLIGAAQERVHVFQQVDSRYGQLHAYQLIVGELVPSLPHGLLQNCHVGLLLRERRLEAIRCHEYPHDKRLQ